MRIHAALVLTISLALFGCGKSKDAPPARGSPSANKDQNETGNFNYHLSGSNCDTGPQSFSKRSEYCQALTNDTLNDFCGLAARKEAYLNECGNDFEQTQVGFIQIYGYDGKLKKSCSVGNDFPKGYKFPKMSDYCNFLRDETLNEKCFWEDRKEEFLKNACAGSFSERPY